MKISTEITTQLIINAIDAADIGYWATVPKGADTADLLAGIARATIVETEGSHDGSTNGRHILTSTKVRSGLTIMASKYPSHFSDLIQDNADCWTGDTLVQCAIFGSLIYG